MKIKLLGSYRNSKGTLVFRYAVTGTVAQIAEYKAAQGDFFRESDDKTPLWFSTRFVGNSADLIITQKGKVVADMSQFDAAASIASQYGGNLGQELAKAAAASLLGGNSRVASTPAPVENTEDLSKS